MGVPPPSLTMGARFLSSSEVKHLRTRLRSNIHVVRGLQVERDRRAESIR